MSDKLDELGGIEAIRFRRRAFAIKCSHIDPQTKIGCYDCCESALIQRVESQQQEIDRLKAQNEIMKAQRTEQISENQLLKAENEKLRGLVWLADKGRCMKCEWPLESSPDKGCVPGNCSYRPHDGTVEHAKWAERNALIAKAREVLGE